MFHKLHVLRMNDDLWDKVPGLDESCTDKPIQGQLVKKKLRTELAKISMLKVKYEFKAQNEKLKRINLRCNFGESIGLKSTRKNFQH